MENTARNSNGINIDMHPRPPERRKKPSVTVVCGGCSTCCCCCSCCCAFALGSVVGATVASAVDGASGKTSLYDLESGDVPSIAKPGIGAVVVFWQIVVMMLVGVFGLIALGTGSPAGALLAIVLGMPIWLFVSLLACLVVYACWPRPDKSEQLGRLGKIGLWVFLGTLIGGGADIVLFVLFFFLVGR